MSILASVADTISITIAPFAKPVGLVEFDKFNTSPILRLVVKFVPVTVLLFAGIVTDPIEVQEEAKEELPVPTS